MMKPKLFLITTLVLILMYTILTVRSIVVAQAPAPGQEVTITTYYPAPYGTYTDLTARRLVIGTDTAPTQNGIINFQPLAANPAWADEGAVYYNSTTHELRYFDGTRWIGTKSISVAYDTGAPAATVCPAGYRLCSPPQNEDTIPGSGRFLCSPSN